MNYKALKWMMENLTQTYKCPECSSDVDESYVDIVWAAWSTINIDIECHNCHKHSMIKSEVLTFNLAEIWDISKLKSKLSGKLNPSLQKKELIKDEEIVKLNKDLKNETLLVEDLLKEDD